MRNRRLSAYLVSLILSVLLHFAISALELPVKDEIQKEAKQKRLKISLKTFKIEKPQPKPVPLIKKTEPEQVKREQKKVVKKTKVKKKIEKPEKKIKRVKRAPAQKQVVQKEPEQVVVQPVVEIKSEPEQEIVQIHKPAEQEPKPLFDYKAYMDSVLRRIELNKSYPYLARKKGQQGVVKINVLIGVDGGILDFKLEKSSGHRLLDKNAKELVASVFPVENKSGEEIRFVIPVRYRLD